MSIRKVKKRAYGLLAQCHSNKWFLRNLALRVFEGKPMKGFP